MSELVECPFCDAIGIASPVLSNRLAVAFLDSYPVTPGHLLVIPRRHATWRCVSNEERDAMLSLVGERCLTGSADGYNVGVNMGSAAGQTIEHAHVHVIPRRHGDVDDPSGGIRGVIPGKADWRAR